MTTKRILVMEIMGIIGGIATILALTLAPMFYLGTKMESIQAKIYSTMDCHMQELRQDMREFRQDMKDFRKDMKDFHGRFCSLEEKNKNN